jgi:sirohydrochlorin cobaltochelatase
MLSKPNCALVIVGHGTTANPDSSAPTRAHADEIRQRGLFGEVVCAFLREEPNLVQALDALRSKEVYLVPHFISEGYFTRRVIPRLLGLEGDITRRGGHLIKYCKPAGSHPRMTELLLRRAAETAPDAPPENTSLVIAGHGTRRDKNSSLAAKWQVKKIAALNRYGEVMAAFMEEEPLISRWPEFATRPHVVVVPFFIADGLHSYQDIPVLLGIEPERTDAASRREVFRRNPHHLHGRKLYYAGAIGAEPLFAEVLLEQVATFDRTHESGSVPMGMASA